MTSIPSMRALNWKRAARMGLSLVLVIAGVKSAPADPSLLDSPGSTAAAAQGQGDGGDIDFSKLEVVDASLKPKLTLLRIGSQRSTTNNVLTVFAGVRNNTGRKLSFEIETIYKDRTGELLNKSSWIRFSLEPHEETDYRSSSLSDDAVDFTIRVRKPLTATASTHE
jgi:hypothetical protein